MLYIIFCKKFHRRRPREASNNQKDLNLFGGVSEGQLNCVLHEKTMMTVATMVDEEGKKERIPILKRQAEYAAMSRLNEYALKQCDDKVREFAECTKDKLISVIWKCRPLQKAVNECVLPYIENKDLQNEFRKLHAKEFPHVVVGYEDNNE